MVVNTCDERLDTIKITPNSADHKDHPASLCEDKGSCVDDNVNDLLAHNKSEAGISLFNAENQATIFSSSAAMFGIKWREAIPFTNSH